MLSRLFTKKVHNPRTELQFTLDSLTDILIYEAVHFKNKSVERRLRQFEDLTLKFLNLAEEHPDYYKKIAFDSSLENRINESIAPSIFYEDYADTFSTLIKNLIRIFSSAYENKNDDIAYEAVSSLIAILRELTTKAGNDFYVRILLNNFAQLCYGLSEEKRPPIHTLFVRWYITPVFSLGDDFALEYLGLFNQNLFSSFKCLAEANNNSIYQSVISSLNDGVRVPLDDTQQIFNLYFQFKMSGDDLPFSFDEMQNALRAKGAKNTPQDIEKLCKEIDRIIDLLLPFSSSASDSEKLLKAAEKTKVSIVGNYKYNSLIQVMFAAAAYFLFKERYEFIYYLWEYHQPSDSDGTWCGEDLLPGSLDNLFYFYVKYILPERSKWHFDGHHGESFYLFKYFILFALRLISKGENASINITKYSAQEKALIYRKIDSIKEALGNLNISEENMTKLGFKPQTLETAIRDFHSRLEILKSNLEADEDRRLITTPPDQSKIAEFKEDFLAGFMETAALRKLFIENDALVNLVNQEPPSPSDKSRLGISVLLDKPVFFSQWHVHYMDYGATFGRGIGSDEANIIFSQIRELCTPRGTVEELFGAILALSKTLEDIIVIASYEYIHSHIVDSPAFIPEWRVSEKTDKNPMFEGYYKIGESNIPIYQIHLDESVCLVLDKTKFGTWVQHNPLYEGESSDLLFDIFYFKLVAFSQDSVLLEQYTSKAENPDKEKEYLQKHILFDAYERFEFVPSEHFQGYVLSGDSLKSDDERILLSS